MENKLKKWLKEIVPVVWKEQEYAKVYYLELVPEDFAAVIEWEEDFDNEEYYDGCCPCVSIRKINSSYFVGDWIIPTLQTLSLEQEVFQDRLQSITNWLMDELKEAESIFKLITFKREALALARNESISYEVNDMYTVAVTVDEGKIGYNCELIYGYNGDDEIQENVLIAYSHPTEVGKVIDYLIGRVNNEN